jgi:hypothetical protein
MVRHDQVGKRIRLVEDPIATGKTNVPVSSVYTIATLSHNDMIDNIETRLKQDQNTVLYHTVLHS